MEELGDQLGCSRTEAAAVKITGDEAGARSRAGCIKSRKRKTKHGHSRARHSAKEMTADLQRMMSM
jgi:hypothetical protein